MMQHRQQVVVVVQIQINVSLSSISMKISLFIATIAIDDVDSDTESAVSHLSLDEDLQSVVGDGCYCIRDINYLYFIASADSTITDNDESMLQDKLGEYLDNAAHKKYLLLFI
jgi:hypothetical protein